MTSSLFPSGVDAGSLGVGVAVYPLVPTRSFDEPLTYLAAGDVAARVEVGSIVEVPVGTAHRVGVVAEVGVAAPDGVALREVERLLDVPAVPGVLVRLAEQTAQSCGSAATRALALVVPPRLSAHSRATEVPVRRSVQAVVAVPGATAPEGLSARLRAVAAALPDDWTPVAAALTRLGTTRPSLARLVEAGLARIEERFVDELAPAADDAEHGAAEAGGGEAPAVTEGHVELTDEQHAAVATCREGTADDPATVLVGITGSGKTEVYLELVAEALADGRTAIVLVPEIALTPQTARRFLRRFPGQVEVLHSGLTRAQRDAAWHRIAAGRARLVVGPRSAIFAPLRDVGVIAIDEEHDGSYKQDSEPRYDARRVAWMRARLEGALLVYGSATPRPESWHGVHRRARLHTRAAGGRLAPVRLVDLRVHGDGFPITAPMQAAIDATLRRGRKAIVMHNRRGYANAVHCRSCGHTFRCGRCDVSLVVHGRSAGRQTFACHHCGFRGDVPRHCPHCNAADIVRLGAGSERLERELADRFGVPVFRLDADTAQGGAVGDILAEFAAAGPSVLTGTQMVAKGHDFPDVELAVVVDADTALAIPDFRAEERAFSLVAQLAGRAGRSADTAADASVLVQSWDVDAEFLQLAAAHDVEGFLTREIERRRALDYPPFTRIVRVLVSARDEPTALGWARVAAEGIGQMEAGQVLGPAPLMRIANRNRAHVIVKTRSAGAIATAMRGFLRSSAAARRRDDVRMLVDVDPQSMS